jgi:hypothetical protein
MYVLLNIIYPFINHYKGLENSLDYNNNLTIMRNNSPSPFRSGVYSGEDSTSHLIRRLEQENEILNQENSALRGRVKKVNELEDKIELVLKHNGNLLNENEQLSRLLNQRKS